jgi:NAD-dependent DNA ligase
MVERPSDALLNTFGNDRIASRQVDELNGLARGIAADGVVTVEEAEFLQKWLVANAAITDQPLIRDLYRHVTAVLSDHAVDADECRDLVGTLNALSTRDFELGEPLKPTTLPLSKPPPALVFPGQDYCFTGTFMFGPRKQCEKAIVDRGGRCGSLTHKTDVLVIGTYATESWKHSSFGLKIMRACEWRDLGLPIVIVSEAHWTTFL